MAAKPARQPALPRDVDWHPRTRAWWRDWKSWPLAHTFTASDWSFLLDTALMHHRMWSEGEMKWAAEIRLRVAKYGSTPEDRQRLRIQFTDPGEDGAADSGRPGEGARHRYGHLRAVDPASADPREALGPRRRPSPLGDRAEDD
ncbi:hypothetical protein [Blastococcus xanthinilyticus]|uniref:phage terminase small subunit n=1 Tax=Blastococcus xanthinilyticus TaxID=1564164 RepID=UPI001AA13A15|nr:hypothetical protein [Blastococcus xanthinilyticus]